MYTCINMHTYIAKINWMTQTRDKKTKIDTQNTKYTNAHGSKQNVVEVTHVKTLVMMFSRAHEKHTYQKQMIHQKSRLQMTKRWQAFQADARKYDGVNQETKD